MTILEKLKAYGYEVVDYCPYYTCSDGTGRDRYVALRAPDGEISKLREGRLNEEYPPEYDAPE